MLRDDITFFDHQVEGIKWCDTKSSFILADQPGLGKTLQTLAAIALDFNKGEAQRALICSPASLKHNWLREVEKFTHFSATVLEGGPDDRAELLEEFDSDLLIVNYEQLPIHKREFNNMGFDIAVFDESHALKNWKAKRTKAASALRAKRKMFLTGTPMLGHVVDLYPVLHMIWPRYYDNFFKFRSRYAVMGGFQNRQVIGSKNQDELDQALEHCMLRRRKADVLDLPDKQYIQVWVPLHADQQALYNEALEDLQITLPDDPDPLELENALTKFLRLKQIASTTANLIDGQDSSYKLDVVCDRALEVLENGKPTIVFTQFRGTNDALRDRLGKHARVFTLTGDTPMADRPKVVDDWSESNGVLIAQIQVAGVGLTMTAADTVIFAEKTFTPALNEQAVDRIHRIGQTGEAIQIVEVLVEDTIEERAEEILNAKQTEHTKIIDGGQLDKLAFYRAIKETTTHGH